MDVYFKALKIILRKFKVSIMDIFFLKNVTRLKNKEK